jgi:hypothetical protein
MKKLMNSTANTDTAVVYADIADEFEAAELGVASLIRS